MESDQGRTGAMMEAPVISLKAIGKNFGHFIALDDINLDIRRGEFITLLGESGSGKTTTLRLISGFEHPSDGTIYMNGQVINTVPAHKRRVNTVFQNYALFPHMKVLENIEYGLRFDGVPKPERRKRAMAMLERVGLSDKASQRPDALSGGQMQRVALARALIKEPEVLLLDEPLSALDAKLRKEMQVELKRTQRQTGITFVYVTHDQEEALVMSDRIAVMEHGHIRQLGTPEEIFEHPQSLFVATFVGASNHLEGRVLTMDGSQVIIQLPNGEQLVAQSDHPFGPGDTACLIARTEHVHLAGSHKDNTNTLRGCLEDVIYLGVERRLVFRIADDRRIELQERGSRLPRDIDQRRGQTIDIELPRETLRAFPPQDIRQIRRTDAA